MAPAPIQGFNMVRELPAELAKIAKDELNEDPNRTNSDIQHLKEWISKQPHLKARTDDQWLVAMLRGCKFSLERAKQKLDLYYTLRTTAPDVTLRLKPSSQQFLEFLRLGTIVILPKRSHLEPRIIVIRPGICDGTKHCVAEMVCMLYYMVQILVTEDDTATVVGSKVIVDYQGVTMSHFAQAAPSHVKKFVTVCQDAMPLRLKGSHHVNMPSGIDAAMSIVKSFMNEKARQRLKTHKSVDELKEFIPEEILPKDYGGVGKSIADIIDDWAKMMSNYKSWMQEEETLGTDESKRPGKPKTAEDMFGVQGSFRKLDLD